MTLTATDPRRDPETLENWLPDLRRVAGRVAARTGADPDDLVQEAYLSLHAEWAAHDPLRSTRRSWVYSRARLRMLDAVRLGTAPTFGVRTPKGWSKMASLDDAVRDAVTRRDTPPPHTRADLADAVRRIAGRPLRPAVVRAVLLHLAGHPYLSIARRLDITLKGLARLLRADGIDTLDRGTYLALGVNRHCRPSRQTQTANATGGAA